MSDDVTMQGVREYAEGYDVFIGPTEGFYNFGGPRDGAGRLAVKATNEGGFNGTEVDLLDLLMWLHVNRPDIIETVLRQPVVASWRADAMGG